MRTSHVPHSYLGFLLSQHAGAVQRATAEALMPLGIQPRGLGVLEVLSAGGPLSQRAIGYICRVDRTTMVAIVDELELEGLAARDMDPDDRRAHLVRLTRRAAGVLRQARTLARRVEDRHCARLSAGERKALLAILQRMLPPVTDCGSPVSAMAHPARLD